MSRSLRFLSFFLFVSLIFSCQKETSFEMGQLGQGSLQSSSGDCLPKLVNGTYKTGQALADSNYIEVTVNVTQTGAWSISTDTLNGYYFNGAGTFGAVGAATVRLKGHGTPGTAGPNNFTVSFDSTSCNIIVTVVQGTGGGGGSAVYAVSGNPGACMNSNVAGTYTQNTALTAANKVTVEVNVTTLGTWNISTTTVTGFSFSGSGTFTTLGVQTITLNGGGTPSTVGNQTFTVNTGTSSCTFTVPVVANTAPPAVFTLLGSGSACISYNLAGTYTQGTALGSSNTVTIQVNVTTAGQWSVSTNTVDGFSFSGSGTFASTGNQSIVLTATGTPTSAGSQTFSVMAGSSSCTFPVTVSGPPTGDHFILTTNSWWSFNTPVSASDTLKRTVVGAATINSISYQAMKELNASSPAVVDDTLYFRKAGNIYTNVNYVDFYTTFYFDNAIVDTLVVCKEGLATGDTWNSPVYSDAENGVPTKIKYNFTCTNNNATVTLNGHTFNNVYQITMVIQKSVNNGAYTTDVTYTNYYAQGVGWIYQKYDDGTSNYQLPIRYYQVF